MTAVEASLRIPNTGKPRLNCAETGRSLRRNEPRGSTQMVIQIEAAICAFNLLAESSIWLDPALRNGSRLPFAEHSQNNDAGTRKLVEHGISALVKTGWPGE
jgi:hypothetical protein